MPQLEALFACAKLHVRLELFVLAKHDRALDIFFQRVIISTLSNLWIIIVQSLDADGHWKPGRRKHQPVCGSKLGNGQGELPQTVGGLTNGVLLCLKPADVYERLRAALVSFQLLIVHSLVSLSQKMSHRYVHTQFE